MSQGVGAAPAPVKERSVRARVSPSRSRSMGLSRAFDTQDRWIDRSRTLVTSPEGSSWGERVKIERDTMDRAFLTRDMYKGVAPKSPAAVSKSFNTYQVHSSGGAKELPPMTQTHGELTKLLAGRVCNNSYHELRVPHAEDFSLTSTTETDSTVGNTKQASTTHSSNNNNNNDIDDTNGNNSTTTSATTTSAGEASSSSPAPVAAQVTAVYPQTASNRQRRDLIRF